MDFPRPFRVIAIQSLEEAGANFPGWAALGPPVCPTELRDRPSSPPLDPALIGSGCGTDGNRHGGSSVVDHPDSQSDRETRKPTHLPRAEGGLHSFRSSPF